MAAFPTALSVAAKTSAQTQVTCSLAWHLIPDGALEVGRGRSATP